MTYNILHLFFWKGINICVCVCICVYVCVYVCEMIIEEMWKAAGERADQPEWLGLNQSSFFFLIDVAGCINGREGQ